MRRLGTQLICLLVVSYLAPRAIAEEWSQFRGTNADGIVSDAELPLTWGPDNQVRWKISLPGVGWSQPIVWDNKIIVTAAETDKQSKPDPKSTGPGIGGYASLFSAGT